MQKKITIIGSGNTATVLGRLLKSVGYIIQGIYSRTPVHADSLAAELDAIQHGSFDNISQEADLFIIAVQDKAIATVAGMLQLPGKIVVHTSGSVPAGVLKQVSANYGVLYPLQSLRKEVLRIPEIPFLVFGANHHTRQQLFQLAKNISANVEYAGDEARLKLHLAAVIASNFTNYMYALANDFCIKESLDFTMLAPLIQEVAQRVLSHPPSSVQTGPARRNDRKTIDQHLQLLKNYPRQQLIYQVLTDNIIKFYAEEQQ